jgi:hypothetical protein
LYGAWDYIHVVSCKISSQLLDKFISTFKREKYLQGMFGRALSKQNSSEEAVYKQATAVKYQSYLSRHKFNFVCKTSSELFL